MEFLRSFGTPSGPGPFPRVTFLGFPTRDLLEACDFEPGSSSLEQRSTVSTKNDTVTLCQSKLKDLLAKNKNMATG